MEIFWSIFHNYFVWLFLISDMSKNMAWSFLPYQPRWVFALALILIFAHSPFNRGGELVRSLAIGHIIDGDLRQKPACLSPHELDIDISSHNLRWLGRLRSPIKDLMLIFAASVVTLTTIGQNMWRSTTDTRLGSRGGGAERVMTPTSSHPTISALQPNWE